MNFAEMTRRTGLEIRRLRYVVDYDVLDRNYYGRGDKARTGHGVAREFSPFAAFAIALTAVLREMGLNRTRVRSALGVIFGWASPTDVPGDHPMIDAFVAFRAASAIDVEIADGRSLRVVVKKSRASRTGMQVPPTSAWADLDNLKETDTVPKALFTTRISLSELYKRLIT